MTGVEIDGRTFYYLEEVAQWYEVETSFLAEVYERGLLGRGLRREDRTLIEASMVDRVAAVLRIRRIAGDDLDAIESWLGPGEEETF